MKADSAVSGLIRGFWPQRPRGRVFILLVVLTLWALVVLVRLLQLTLFPGERVLAAIQKDSWVEGEIPAPRGCILDRNGYPLAWSSRHFLVRWRVPQDRARAADEYAILSRVLGGNLPVAVAQLPDQAEGCLVLKRDLSPRELAVLAELRAEMSGLAIESYTVRHRCVQPDVQQRIGTVAMVDDREAGVSGEEKFNDEMLSGRPGRFRVMVDKDGKWLKQTWQKTMDILPGYDVYLPITVGSSGSALADNR